MNTKQMLQRTDVSPVPQERRSSTVLAGHTGYSFFLQIRLDDADLFSLALNLMASSDTDQIIWVSPCRQYIPNVDTQAMEEESGVLVSVVLPNSREAELAKGVGDPGHEATGRKKPAVSSARS